MLRVARLAPRRAALCRVRGLATFQHLLIEPKQSSLRITLNRPDLHNSFNEEVIDELRKAFHAVDPKTTRSVVLTGAGPSFSAGADLNYMKKMGSYTHEQNQEDAFRLFDMFKSIRSCPVPVIARVNGACMGGGVGLVSACDMAFAVKTAKFAFTEVSLGLVPAVISRFVMDKIGRAQASRYFLTAERFEAQKAKEIGLVHEVVETEAQLDEAVQETVDRIAKNGPNAVQATKALIDQVAHWSEYAASAGKQGPDALKQHLAGVIAAARVSPEGQEGLKSFFEKRKATWAAGSSGGDKAKTARR